MGDRSIVCTVDKFEAAAVRHSVLFRVHVGLKEMFHHLFVWTLDWIHFSLFSQQTLSKKRRKDKKDCRVKKENRGDGFLDNLAE